jgi:hypothetical protein
VRLAREKFPHRLIFSLCVSLGVFVPWWFDLS